MRVSSSHWPFAAGEKLCTCREATPGQAQDESTAGCQDRARRVECVTGSTRTRVHGRGRQARSEARKTESQKRQAASERYRHRHSGTGDIGVKSRFGLLSTGREPSSFVLSIRCALSGLMEDAETWKPQ